MAINDFAGPIIQAFLTGQQIKRQREQDVLATQERERLVKDAERQAKRQEQQDKIAASVRRMEVENMLRAQMASGQRTIPTSEMIAPGGLATPQVSPVVQQLLTPGLQQPLQETSTMQTPIQLGREFAIPETQRVQQPMLEVPEIGTFDLSQFPSYEETMRRRLMERGVEAQLDIIKAGAVSKAQAEGKLPAQLEVEDVKNKGRLEAANVKSAAQTTQQATRFEQQKELERIRRENRAVEEVQKQQNRVAITKLAESLRSKRKGQETTEDLEGTLQFFADGTYTTDDMSKVPAPLRQEVTNALKARGIVPLNRTQVTGIGQFKVAAGFIRDMKALASEIERSPTTAALPRTERENLESALLSKIEQYSKAQLGVQGVLTENDILRQKGAMPSAAIRTNRTVDNRRRIVAGIRALREKFESQYRNLPDATKARLVQEAGLEDLFEDTK